MTSVFRRLSALVLAIGLIAGQAGLCAGWMPSAEARMDCCEDGSCPMHKKEHEGSKVGATISQADADACCAEASGHDSTSSTAPTASAISVAVLGEGTALIATAPPLVLSSSRRVLAPVPLASPPRHVLLSTFLI